MDRETAIAKLRACQGDRRRAGGERPSLFGAMARGDQRIDSDVDGLARIDPARKLSLLDWVGLEQRLTEILGVHVDVTPEPPKKNATVCRPPDAWSCPGPRRKGPETSAGRKQGQHKKPQGQSL